MAHLQQLQVLTPYMHLSISSEHRGAQVSGTESINGCHSFHTALVSSPLSDYEAVCRLLLLQRRLIETKEGTDDKIKKGKRRTICILVSSRFFFFFF